MPTSGNLTGVPALLFIKSTKCQKEILSKMIQSLVCPICQEFMYVPMMIQCGHNYCYTCLSAWFNSNPEDELSCPQCRGNVINIPCKNATLQQLLRSVIDVVKDGDNTKELAGILNDMKSSEARFKRDCQEDDLFKGAFRNSAVGIADEDDDGILRCSNCHWELEDDEDGLCPHCQMRIRSRDRPRQASSESDDDETTATVDSSQHAYMPYATLDYTYASKLDELLFHTSSSELFQMEHDRHLPFRLLNLALADGTIVYFPSYTLYLFLSCEFTPAGRMLDGDRLKSIITALETPSNSITENEDDLINHFNESNSDQGVTIEQFKREVRQYASSVRKYQELLRLEAEKHPTEGYSAVHALQFKYPFIAEMHTEAGDRIVFPSISLFIKADHSLGEDQREEIIEFIRPMEEIVAEGNDLSAFTVTVNHLQNSRSDYDDDSLEDFIASDDDDNDSDNGDIDSSNDAGGVVDLEAEQSSDEPDSDYYERNEGDGYVSGDSLNDDIDDDDDQEEQGQEQDDDDDDDEDDDDDDDLDEVRIPRKRSRAIIETSDNDSS